MAGVREVVKHLYMIGTSVRVTFVTSITMVSGTNGKLLLVIVIVRLRNGTEFTWINRHDPMPRITWLYLCSYNASEEGRRSPKRAVQVPKYI